MNRDEALEEFNKNAIDIIDEYKLKFEENLKGKEEKLEKALLNSIKDLNKEIIKCSEKTPEYKVMFLHFELLRTNVLDENFKIWLHGYNGLWHLDEDSVHVEVDFKFLFKPFLEMKQELLKNIKVYLGKVTKYDVNTVIFGAVSSCYNQLSFLARKLLWELDEKDFMNNIELLDHYVVRWGEYNDRSEIIFAMDYRIKLQEELESLKKIDEKNMPFVYTVWRNGEYIDCDLSNKNLLFINFKESTLKKSNFDESDIVSGEFKKTTIKECSFENSRVVGTTFKDSKLSECKFDNSDLRSSNFQYADIYNVSFKGCILNNVDFRNCIIENVDFTEAEVKGTIFSREVIPYLHLSPEQLQDIFIEGGGE